MKNDMSENDRLARAVERYQLINPLLDQELDRAERSSIMEKIAGENNISVRQLQRYCKTFTALYSLFCDLRFIKTTRYVRIRNR